MSNLIDLTPFPTRPENEVPRDNLVIQIATNFTSDCQKQAVVGQSLTGKTNLLAQFARYYPDRCLSYFITEDPWTQRPYNFIYVLCNQLCELLNEPLPLSTVDLDDIKIRFTVLVTKLNRKARTTKTPYYWVIDGLEWGSQGHEGDRIVDILPSSFPVGPYLLYSCQESKLEQLPKHIQAHKSYLPLAFSQSETQDFLKHVGFSLEMAKEIHKKHNGNPGTLKAVYDAKKTDPEFSATLALQKYDRVIEQQIKFLVMHAPESVKATLNYLSTCPTGIPTAIIAKLQGINEEDLLNSLNNLNNSIFDIRNGRVDFYNNTARTIYCEQIGKAKDQYFGELLRFIETNFPNEEFLLTRLYVEGNDYQGLQRQLSPSSILTTIEKPLGGVSSVIQRLRSASQIANTNKDYEGLLKWTLGISTVKSYIEHTISYNEIQALIAIGDSEEALRKAYLLPDLTNQIRFLARIYSAMKAKNERVSKEAKDELKGFINNLRVNELDKEIVQKLAIDIFPILPDVSVLLLDTINTEQNKKSVIELFAKAISEKFKESDISPEVINSEKYQGNLIYTKIMADWLEDKPLLELESELNSTEKTEAKEQIIRQWCKQNPNSPDLAKGVLLWLEIVKSDMYFVITLKALQQISSLLTKIPIQQRVLLIQDLNVPRITALDSPKQAWIRFNLNIAEAMVEIDPQESFQRITNLLVQVLTDPLDLDVKTFCLARILSSLARVFPTQVDVRDEVEKAFNSAFYSLLENSAEQYDSLNETLGAFVDFDLDYALVMAISLNLSLRRERAVSHIFRVALLRKGNEILGESIKEVLRQLDERLRTKAVINTLSELRLRGRSVCQDNRNILFDFIKQFEDPTERAIALSYLAALTYSESEVTANELANSAIDAWKQEEDLRTSLSVGFQLVDTLSAVNIELAKTLYREVKALFKRPGTPLAMGNLGIDFVANIELTMRALIGLPNNLIKENLEEIDKWILRIPSKKIQGELYAKLASSLYRVDLDKEASEMVRSSVLPIITKLLSPVDRRELISFSLPIIYKYDKTEAYTLGDTLLWTQKDGVWLSVILWSFANCFLGDQTGIKPSALKAVANRPQLIDAIDVAQRIDQDVIVHTTIEVIAQVVGNSFSCDRVNPTQAIEILDKLDQLIATKLPDSNNIKHEGYVILAQSEVHRVRSLLFNWLTKKQNTRGLYKEDIGKKWQKLYDKASQIPNIADRVFVLTLLARNMSDYHEKDKAYVATILKSADEQINKVPTIVDRLERLDTIAETWHILGHEASAEYAVEKELELLREFQGSSKDDKLKALVQTAYAIGDIDLASEIVSQFDKPRPEGVLTTPERALQIQALRKQPNKIDEFINATNLVHEREHILTVSTNHLLNDLVTGRGKTDHPQTLGSWLRTSHDLHPTVIKHIAHWVVESWVRGSSKKNITIFRENIDLILKLAKATFAVDRKGIPEAIEDSFAGLSSKFVVFRSGDKEKAQAWLRQWLETNAQKYLKICDPYFGLEEIEYFSVVPENCIVFVVTTTKGLTQNDPESIKRHWQKISTRTIPFIRFTVVSSKSEHRFHDRVIISSNCGLDIGPSLNGLGKSQQKIAVLSADEANELEHKYLKDMLDSTVWLMEYGENPSVFSVGEVPQ